MNLSPDGQKLLGEVFKWEVVRRSSIGEGWEWSGREGGSNDPAKQAPPDW